MSSKRKGGACNLTSSSEEDEGSTENVKKESGRKRPVWQTFRIYSSGFVTESNREERKKVATKIPLDGTTSEGKIRDILIKELPQLRDKSFKFFTKDKAGKRYFCPCSLQCEGGDHDSEEWNGRNIPRAAKSNRAVYILIESTTVEETRSGGVQNDSPTNPVSSDPQFRGSVGQYSSNPLNQKEVRVVVKDHDSVSCPDLSLSGLEHQENISVPPLSAKYGNDLSQWPTQLTQLSQEQTVPKTEYKKVKDGGRVTEENEGEGEEQKDEGDEEMQTDMWNNDVASTSENVFPQRHFESGYDTFSSENNALLLVDPANSVEDEELQSFLVNDSAPLDTNFNGTSLLSTPTEFMELYQEYPRTPRVIKEIVPKRGDVAGGETFYLSLTDVCAINDFQVQFGPSTIPVEKCGDKDFKGKVPASSTAGVVQVYLVNFLLETISNSVPFEYFDPNRAMEDFVRKDIKNVDKFQHMLFLLSRHVGEMDLNSNETKDTKETNQPGGGKTQALSLLYMIADTAAMLNAIDFFRIIFSTHVGHSVFKSCKDAPTPLEEIARGNGHEELACLLEQKHTKYQDYENESDDEVDWKELARAIDKYQTLKGETAEKKSIPSTSSSERIHGYLGDGESSTSLSSLHLLDVEGCPESAFEEQQTTPESRCAEGPNTCQEKVPEACPENTLEEQQTTPESRCGEGRDTCQATVAECCSENTLEEQQTIPNSRCGEEPDTCQTTEWAAVVKCSLPPPTAPFVGRNLECHEIVANLTLNHRRIGIIHGIQGIGKTTVAVEVGHMLLSKGWHVHYHLCRDHDGSLDMSALLPQAQAISGISHPTLFILDMDMCIENDGQDKLRNAFQSFAESVTENGHVGLLFVIREGMHFLENVAFSCNLQPLSSSFAVELLKATSRKSPVGDLKAIAEVCDYIPHALMVARDLIQDGMSETDIINMISSSDKLLMDKAHKVKDSHSSIGEKSLLVTSCSNTLHLGGGDRIIGKAYPLHMFAPKEVLSLKRKLQSYGAGKTIPSSFYPDRDQVIHNLMERLDTPPELDFLKEPKRALTGGLEVQKGSKYPETAEKELYIARRKGAMAMKFAKSESVPKLYPPLSCERVESVTKSVALEESVSNISFHELSSESEPGQDARPSVEQFFEGVQNERKSVCLLSASIRNFTVLAVLLLLMIVGIVVAIVILNVKRNRWPLASEKEPTTSTNQRKATNYDTDLLAANISVMILAMLIFTGYLYIRKARQMGSYLWCNCDTESGVPDSVNHASQNCGVHYKPTVGNLDVVENGSAKRDKVNHGILSTESTEPLLREGNRRNGMFLQTRFEVT